MGIPSALAASETEGKRSTMVPSTILFTGQRRPFHVFCVAEKTGIGDVSFPCFFNTHVLGAIFSYRRPRRCLFSQASCSAASCIARKRCFLSPSERLSPKTDNIASDIVSMILVFLPVFDWPGFVVLHFHLDMIVDVYPQSAAQVKKADYGVGYFVLESVFYVGFECFRK